MKKLVIIATSLLTLTAFSAFADEMITPVPSSTSSASKPGSNDAMQAGSPAISADTRGTPVTGPIPTDGIATNKDPIKAPSATVPSNAENK